MVKPNTVNRDLTGVAGMRFFNVPGVTYPPEVLKVKMGLCQESGMPYETPPPWGITTDDAAIVLGCSSSAARAMLHRKKVTYRLVSRPHGPPITYWNKKKVKLLAQAKSPIISEEEASKLLTTEQAANLLGVSRSTVQRAMQSGIVHPVHVRVLSDQGPRKRAYLRREEVQKWGRQLRAKQLRGLQRQLSSIGRLHAHDPMLEGLS